LPETAPDWPGFLPLDMFGFNRSRNRCASPWEWRVCPVGVKEKEERGRMTTIMMCFTGVALGQRVTSTSRLPCKFKPAKMAFCTMGNRETGLDNFLRRQRDKVDRASDPLQITLVLECLALRGSRSVVTYLLCAEKATADR
jgi:hypothetical protein